MIEIYKMHDQQDSVSTFLHRMKFPYKVNYVDESFKSYWKLPMTCVMGVPFDDEHALKAVKELLSYKSEDTNA